MVEKWFVWDSTTNIKDTHFAYRSILDMMCNIPIKCRWYIKGIVYKIARDRESRTLYKDLHTYTTAERLHRLICSNFSFLRRTKSGKNFLLDEPH